MKVYLSKSIKCNFGQFEVWKKCRDQKKKTGIAPKFFLQIVSYRIVGSICRSQFGGKNLTRYLFFLFFLVSPLFSNPQIVAWKILANFSSRLFGTPLRSLCDNLINVFPHFRWRRHYRATKEHRRDKVFLVVKSRGIFSFFWQLSGKENFKRRCGTAFSCRDAGLRSPVSWKLVTDQSIKN